MARWVGRVNDKEGLTEQIGIMGFERDYYERVYAKAFLRRSFRGIRIWRGYLVITAGPGNCR